MGIRTEEGKVEAYVFERHIEATRMSGLRDNFGGQPGVAFVAQFVGAFSLFGRVLADDLRELQGRIDVEYFDAGIRSDWSVNLTGSRDMAPKRHSPPICALVKATVTVNPYQVVDRIDEVFAERAYGAAVVTAPDFDVLVDLGADTLEEVVDMLFELRRDVGGIGTTSTAFADLTDNEIRN